MEFEVVISEDAERDLDLIFGFLVQSQMEFGEAEPSAFKIAERRIQAIRKDLKGLARHPYRGTLRENLSPNLRNHTVNRAIAYFEIEEEEQRVRIMALFFGGQDHQNRMIARLLGQAR